MNPEGSSILAVRFQHGLLSRGGRRRSSPPGNACAEGSDPRPPRPANTTACGQQRTAFGRRTGRFTVGNMRAICECVIQCNSNCGNQNLNSNGTRTSNPPG